jgi:quercetin dioxygenase-like cupin family protein
MSSRVMHVRADEGRRMEVLGSDMCVKATGRDTDGRFDVVEVVSGPGGDIVPHRHPWSELYVVLDGTMDVQIGRRTFTAGPGDLLHIPARALHGFHITSEHARFLHISAGTEAVEVFDEYHAVSPGAPALDDLDAITAILDVNDRHGIEVVLPTGV